MAYGLVMSVSVASLGEVRSHVRSLLCLSPREDATPVPGRVGLIVG